MNLNSFVLLFVLVGLESYLPLNLILTLVPNYSPPLPV